MRTEAASNTSPQVSLLFPAAAQPEGRQVANMGKEHRYRTLTKFILHWARLPDKSHNVLNKSASKFLTSTFIFKDDTPLSTPLLTLYQGFWSHCFPIPVSQLKVTSRHNNRCPFLSNWSFATLWPLCLDDTGLIRHLSLTYSSPQQ